MSTPDRARYVVSSEFSRSVRGDRSRGRRTRDYSAFRGGAHCTKALKILRPRGLDADRRHLLATYLAYHVYRMSPTTSDSPCGIGDRHPPRSSGSRISIFRRRPFPCIAPRWFIARFALRACPAPPCIILSAASKPNRSILRQRSGGVCPSMKAARHAVADGFMRYADVIYENGNLLLAAGSPPARQSAQTHSSRVEAHLRHDPNSSALALKRQIFRAEPESRSAQAIGPIFLWGIIDFETVVREGVPI